jgi:hypothetical protein
MRIKFFEKYRSSVPGGVKNISSFHSVNISFEVCVDSYMGTWESVPEGKAAAAIK